MRNGACSVQQALTAEAACVLKQSLGLARRRGHAQVTPLHVAATLLTTTSSSSLLRRACLKSQHPHHLLSSPHPLHCRALELCFNVALNRLPTTPPPPPPPSSSSSSSPLLHAPNLSLSNALIAALKRAQAHQRRGCIEHQQQQHQQSFHQHQQQQPLLAIKVELEQLIISILDDPSVSRVMREAGFSSTTVKTNLEEVGSSSTTTSTTSSAVLSPPPSFFFDSSHAGAAHFLNTRLSLLKPHPPRSSHGEEDLKVVVDVMTSGPQQQQQQRGRRSRSNAVVVGDSASYAEGVVGELMGRVERGEAFFHGGAELNHSHSIRLHLSCAHLRLMSRSEVDAKVSDLRRRLASLASQRRGVIIYAGDLRWALDGETGAGDDGFSAVEHLIEQVGTLVAELKATKTTTTTATSSSNCCKVWLMAAASYQTYMRCQVRHPSLETRWALQAVMVPSGGLKLSLQAPSVLDSRVTKLTDQYPFQVLEPKAFNAADDEEEEEEEKLLCCTTCSLEFAKDVSIFKSKASQLPYWLQPHNASHLHKDAVHELRRKWNRHCRSLHHHHQHATSVVLPPSLPSNQRWPNSFTDNNEKTTLAEPRPVSFSLQLNGTVGGSAEASDRVRTTLSLGRNSLMSGAATPAVEKRSGATVSSSRDLHDRLQENIPWQSGTIPSIVEALLDRRRSCERKGTWLLIQGTDRIGKRRLARVAAECLRGSTGKLVYIDSRSERGIETLKEAMRKDPRSVVFIEDIDRAHTELTRALAEGLQNGLLKEDPFGKEVDLAHGMFILTTSNSRDDHLGNENPNKVLKMVMRFEDETYPDNKRKNQEVDIYSDGRKKKKKQRNGDDDVELDLNVSAEGSDLTHEIMDNDNEVHRLPDRLLESVGVHITMDESTSGAQLMVESFVTRLRLASGGKMSVVDRTTIEGLMGAMGWFIESEFERWVKEVFELSLVTVGKGGKVGLGIEGMEGCVESSGFLGSVLPRRIHVDLNL